MASSITQLVRVEIGDSIATKVLHYVCAAYKAVSVSARSNLRPSARTLFEMLGHVEREDFLLVRLVFGSFQVAVQLNVTRILARRRPN